MQAIPDVITKFIRANHVVNFAAKTADDFWAANCFYAFDEKNHRLIMLSNKSSRHSKLILENPHIVGTIANQVENFSEIEGIQFSAIAKCLEEDEEKKTALSLYYQRHPLARLKSIEVWEIRFQTIKHTCNKLIFAQKTYWQAES